MRLAILTLDSLVSGAAVRQFIIEHAGDIALVGLSNPYRRNMGGHTGQLVSRVRRSGIGILPYLAANFAFPELMSLTGLSRLFPRLFMTSLPQLCEELHVDCVRVEDVNGADFLQTLEHSGVDLVVTFHFDQILKETTIAACRHGGVNVHPSLLPLHRGPLPTYHALMGAPRKFGISVHRLAATIDAGAVLDQSEMAFAENISVVGAAAHLHMKGAEMLGRILERGFPNPAVNDSVLLPYCPFPTRTELRKFFSAGLRLVCLRDLMFWIPTYTASNVNAMRAAE